MLRIVDVGQFTYSIWRGRCVRSAETPLWNLLAGSAIIMWCLKCCVCQKPLFIHVRKYVIQFCTWVATESTIMFSKSYGKSCAIAVLVRFQAMLVWLHVGLRILVCCVCVCVQWNFILAVSRRWTQLTLLNHWVFIKDLRLNFVGKVLGQMSLQHLCICGPQRMIPDVFATVWYASCPAAGRRLCGDGGPSRYWDGAPDPGHNLRWPTEEVGQQYLKGPHTHPWHYLFDPLPSGKRFKTFRSSTNRLRNRFYPPPPAQTHQRLSHTCSVTTECTYHTHQGLWLTFTHTKDCD